MAVQHKVDINGLKLRPTCRCTKTVCTKKQYECKDGRAGRQGRDGEQGYQGKPGRLTIISQLDPIPPAQENVTIDLDTAPGREIRLTRDNWQNRHGAKKLLARGSRVAHDYSLWTGQTQRLVTIDWKSQREPNEFRGFHLTATLAKNNQINFSLY